MNRRRLLVALSVAVPLALFGAAKWATRWRPVKLAALGSAAQSSGFSVVASQDFVDVNGETYDVTTGAELRDTGPLLGIGAWYWGWVEGKGRKSDHPALVLEDPTHEQEKSYPLPTTTKTDGSINDFSTAYVRLSPTQNRVEAVFNNTYYRWARDTRRLERKVSLVAGDLLLFMNLGGPTNTTALARDGESIVYTEFGAIRFIPTRAKVAPHRVTVAGLRGSEKVQVSPFGSYALFDGARGSGASTSMFWHLVDAKTGRVLWSFKPSPDYGDCYFSADEKWIVTPSALGNNWEIRQTQSGAPIRTLPRVPNAKAAAFSPDGSTLYSVADGVLYKQRTR